MSDVLVLNSSFYAIQITSWKRALSLLYLDHARVVDEEYKTYSFENWRQLTDAVKTHPAGIVTTPTFKIAIPDVIALRFFDGVPASEVKFTRRNIYEHYGYRCCYCSRRLPTTELNLDHVVPRSRGGKTDWANVVTSCISCNLKKGDKLPVEARMKLFIKPSKPKWRGAISLGFRSSFKFKASWQRFIDNIYWNSELEREP
jgi:5-methylcytosine-specific restriction endonuclease McrA